MGKPRSIYSDHISVDIQALLIAKMALSIAIKINNLIEGVENIQRNECLIFTVYLHDTFSSDLSPCNVIKSNSIPTLLFV